jgi:GNAT superfamily N-acetyltransferase
VDHAIRPVDMHSIDTAAALLERFFREESFTVRHASVRANLAALLADPGNWAGLAYHEVSAVGIVTVSTVLYVEWGRLGEIGDLYVLPEARGQGIGRALIEAGVDQCRTRGCSAVSVTITPEGERDHALARYYAKSGFMATGRTIVSLGLR